MGEMPNSSRKLLIMLYLVWWASLAAQTVKNLLAVQETWVPSLGQEDPLEKGMAIHSSILAWRILWTYHGVAKSWTQLSNFHSFGKDVCLHCESGICILE